MRAKAFDSFSRSRFHVSGLLAHGHMLGFYVSEPDLKKDSNTSIEQVAHSLQKLHHAGTRLPDTHLVVQADNPCRECKNSMLLRFLGAQVSCGNLVSATLTFLRSGHSHEDLDQIFG